MDWLLAMLKLGVVCIVAIFLVHFVVVVAWMILAWLFGEQ